MKLKFLRPAFWALVVTCVAGCKAPDPNLQLSKAIARNDAAAVKQAIAQGANVNSSVSDATDPSAGEYTPLGVALFRGKKEAAMALIEAKADVNSRGQANESPLGLALGSGDAELINAMLQAGAEVNIPYMIPPSLADGQSLLASVAQHGNVQAVELLLKYKARPDMPDTYGRSAYWHTGGKLTPVKEAALPANQRRIRQLLRQAGANPNPKDYKGRTYEQVQKLEIDYEEEANTDRLLAYTDRSRVGIDSNNLTNRLGTKAKLKPASKPKDAAAQAHLFHAVMKNDIQAVKKALQNKAEINAYFGKAVESRYEYETPLILAIEKGHTNLVLFLLDAGADAMTAASNWPPLHHAARMGNPVMVKALLDKGAEPNYGTYGAGEVALLHGVHSGSVKTVKLLLDSGANPHAIPQDTIAFANEEIILKMIKEARKTYKPKN